MLVSPKDKETLSPSVEDTKLSTNKQHTLSRSQILLLLKIGGGEEGEGGGGIQECKKKVPGATAAGLSL